MGELGYCGTVVEETISVPEVGISSSTNRGLSVETVHQQRVEKLNIGKIYSKKRKLTKKSTIRNAAFVYILRER